MNLKLHYIKRESLEYDSSKRLSFAVVDLDRSNNYPLNFVCMLPLKVEKGKTENCFGKHFGEKSLEQAKELLAGALESADDFEVKVEIKRRLELLEPKKPGLVKCRGCGKVFETKKTRRFRQYFCEECLRRRFGTHQ